MKHYSIVLWLKGEKIINKVLEEILEIFKNKFDLLMTNINKMDVYFGKSFDTTEENLGNIHLFWFNYLFVNI